MAGKRSKKSSSKRKLKLIIINLVLFLVMQTAVGFAFSMPMVYYGPFANIKEVVVTTAMTTLTHQYLATWFLNDEDINSIMEKYAVHDENSQSDVNAISVTDADIEKKDDQVELVNISNSKVKGYILLIKNPSMVKVATSTKIGTQGMKLLDMVKENNAIGGINSGGFGDDGGHGTGGIPMGLLMQDGKVLYGDAKQTYQIIGFNEDSQMVLGRYTIAQAKQNRIKDAVTFGPYLVVNGQGLIKSNTDTPGSLQPRTAIGQKKDGTVIMLVIDGRQPSSLGASLKDVQDIMLQYGAYNAANLDGGSSTTMVYQDQIINSPCSQYGPRSLPSAFIITR
ncbi:MAG: phosphodiester glycosidase family protein [Bacillota bacterium]|nr:phosphodiester glycosidase family protein [Bacillota bacterium]